MLDLAAVTDLILMHRIECAAGGTPDYMELN